MKPYAYATTTLSIISFLIGSFFTYRISKLLGPLRRLTLCSNFLLQGLLIVLAAALATGGVLVSERDANDDEHYSVLQNVDILIGLAPLAWQSGATIATSRLLSYGNEIPVVVLTSTYAALTGDPKLFEVHGNPPRNRRIAAIICVFVGAICATWIQKNSVGMIACLWIGAGIKLLIALGVAVLMPPETLVAG